MNVIQKRNAFIECSLKGFIRISKKIRNINEAMLKLNEDSKTGPMDSKTKNMSSDNKNPINKNENFLMINLAVSWNTFK